MNIQFEEINTPKNSSFRIMVNPKLNDFFFWHFHPEYELVLLDGADGTRHIGHNISQFEGRDLAFIGSNIPHLNFDFGIKTPYEKTVLHIRADFLEEGLHACPEIQAMIRLFEEASHGIVFSNRIIDHVAKRIKHLHELPDFKLFIEVLEIFQILANDDERILLHTRPYEAQYNKREEGKLKALYKFIDDNYDRKIPLGEVASLCNLSREAFCRYFKKMTRLTFTQFLNHYRVNIAKKQLLEGNNVTETCFSCGFESLSYFNRVFKKTTGMNPLAFGKNQKLNEI